MPAWVASVLAFVAVLVTAVAVQWSPLLSNPGPEAGLVFAVVGGVALALAGAVRGAARSAAGAMRDLLSLLIVALAMLVVLWVATTIGAWRAPSCSPNAGRLPLLVLAVPVWLLQAGIGTAAGRLVGRAWRAVIAVLVLEVAAALTILWDFLDEPGFRVASHLFVVIGGDLLRGASLDNAAIAFRVATLLWAGAIAGLGAALWPARRQGGLSPSSTTPWGAWLATAALTVAALVTHSQARQAFAPTRAEVDARYALTKSRGPLVVHADPTAATPREVDGILAEGTLWLERLRSRLGPTSDAPIHIYLHASREAQAWATGASHVDFALPWRRELHIANATVSHATLGHELAHVVVGERSDTALRVPSRFVVLHRAAITEGVAMALTPELAVETGLTLREQAAAMRRTGTAPDVARLFSFARFFTEESGKAYVAAGALIEQLVADADGDAAWVVDRLYKGAGSLEAAIRGDVTTDGAARTPVDALLERHHAALDALELPADALSYARMRFSRRSVLDETCDPDLRDRARAIRVQALLGDMEAALAAVAAWEGEPAEGTLWALAQDARSVGDAGQTIRLLRLLVDRTDNPALKARRLVVLGNELWRSGQERAAAVAWAQAPLDQALLDDQRQLLASATLAEHAVRLGPRAVLARATLGYFASSDTERAGARLALAERIGRPTAEASAEPAEVVALAHYVLARQYVVEGRTEEAVRLLAPLLRGEGASAPLPSVFLEQSAIALATALVRGDRPADAERLFARAAEVATRPATRLLLRDRAERAQRAARAEAAPDVVTAGSDPAWADRLLLGVERRGGL